MPDFRVADTAPEHPKLRTAGLAAAGLWALAGAYAMNPAHMTDGWVPLHWVQTWPSGKKHATKLVEVGLWLDETRNGLPGYQFHDWDGTQRSASKVEDERRKARERMKRLRSGDVRANSPANVRANNGSTFGEAQAERSANVRDSLTPLPKGEGEVLEAAHVGNARGRGATGPNSSAAFNLVRKTLGDQVTSTTRTALTVEVATLLAEATEDEITTALHRWNDKPGIGARIIHGLVDDLRKEARGATSRPAATAPPTNATDAFAARFLAGGQPQQPALRALPGGA